MLVFNSVFYYVSFNVSIIEARLDAREKISNQSASQYLDVIKIPSENTRAPEEDELWYHGKLYDIAASTILHDTVYYYVLEDGKEEEAIGRIYEHFNTESSLLKPGSSTITLHKIIVKGTDQYYHTVNKHICYPGTVFPVLRMPDIYCSCISPEVLTPPPENISIPGFTI